MSQKTFIADKINCSFWWEIEFPATQRIPKMTGYSKFQNFAEAKDKINCLMSKIFMLKKNGYLDKCLKINIYEKIGMFPSNENDKLILIMQRNECKINDVELFKRPDLIQYLKNFYNASKGEKIENLKPLNNYAQYQSKDNLLNVNQYNFKDANEVLQKTEDLRKLNFPHDAVQNFYLKSIDKLMNRRATI